jgi:hypothetical protein
VCGGFFLFGAKRAVPVAAILGAPVPLAFLPVMLVAIPLYGNFIPAQLSFLMSMRYYAGNWAYSVRLFKKGTGRKFDVLNKTVPLLRDQLERITDDPEQADMIDL